MVLHRPIKELKSEGTISLQQFLRLFAPATKTGTVLGLLNRTASATGTNITHRAVSQPKGADEAKETDRGEERRVCRGVSEHVRRLIRLQELQESTFDPQIEEQKRETLKRTRELYGSEGCKCIAGLSQRLAKEPAGSRREIMLRDSGMKRLLAKELKQHRRNNASHFRFPNAKLLDHYVTPPQTNHRSRKRSKPGGTSFPPRNPGS